MAICKLTIESSVDGQATKSVYMGRLEEVEGQIRLFYREENAEICITLEKGEASVRRVGDYSLSLSLVEGKKRAGSLSLGGAEGSVEVYTRTVEYAYADGGLSLALAYDLLFGVEKQKMQLRIQAQTRGKKV